MSKKQWMVLLMLLLTYLLLGASIFYHIESHLEIERVEKAKRERIEINALLYEYYVPSHRHDYDEILGKLTRYCGKSVYNYTEGETDPLKWDFYNSFYFAYTVVSTIGYGNLAPTNMLSRILMIFYGLIGIPINGILLTQLGEFFSRVFVKAHEKYKSYKHGRNDYYPRKLTTFETHKVGLAAQIFAHLMPGFVMFIFFPAFLFSHYEGWTYDESVYYAFVTLTTIGFGDYVAGQDNSKGNGIFLILYKAFLICWICFGLGYTVMIMTFIARGMRSKKITRIEHKLAVNLKHTQSKIWNELNKEMNYLRRVFNELQLSKVKRIYVDECTYEVPLSKFPRSNSFPNLRDLSYGARQEENGIGHRPRRRANSEVVPTEDQLTRVVSETDLQRIDKTATFATHAMVQPAELLARLVNILGYIPPATEDLTGIGGPPMEKESSVDRKGKISDGHGIWTIGNDKIPRFLKPRSRAVSEVRLRETRYEDRNTERTWSGPTAARKMQELMNIQVSSESANKERAVKEAKFSKFRSFSLAKSVPKALISSGPCKNWFSTNLEKKPSESERETNNKDVEEARSFVTGLTRNEDKRRDSRSSIVSNSTRHYYTHTGAGNVIDTEHSNLLEETSVADFLRALTFLHASVATTGSWTAAATTPVTNHDDSSVTQRNQPRRKMGTASLTPPKLPSLFTLFSLPQPSTTHTNQTTVVQESNVNTTNSSSSFFQTCPDSRKESFTFVAPTFHKSRRFSLRPVATPISPPTPPTNGSPFLSDARRESHQNRSTFSSVSPKEPLIRTEQVPGLSSPIKSSFDGRRFSLRPTTTTTTTTTTAAAAPTATVTTTITTATTTSITTTVAGVTTTKPLQRWKAGMLQRQIGQMNLRRRARAFSLSDVQSDNFIEKSEPFVLSSSIYKKNNRGTVRKNVSLHEASNCEEPAVSRTVEIPEQFSSPMLSSNRNSSFSRETIFPNNTRLEDNTTNRSKQLFAIDRLISPENHQRISSSFTITDTELSQQSLLEVKVENPVVTNTIQPSFSNSTDNIRTSPPGNSQNLTDLTITKNQLNSRSNKS